MPRYKRISAIDAYALIRSKSVTIVDSRDAESFRKNHIRNAIHVDNTSVGHFLGTVDRKRPLLVYCSRGTTSQSVATYLNKNGCHWVMSLDGGFAVWRLHFPEECLITDAV